MITTTLNAIRNHDPCSHGWSKLLRHLGKTTADDELLPLVTVLDSNGLHDALWCCRCMPQYDRLWRLFAVHCARRVQHLMTDQRSVAVIDVAEKYANGQATRDELASAYFDAAFTFTVSTSVSTSSPYTTSVSTSSSYTTSAAAAAVAAAYANAADAAVFAADGSAFTFSSAAAVAAERVAQSDAFRQLITTGTLQK